MKYLLATIMLLLNCATGYAIPNDDDFYTTLLSAELSADCSDGNDGAEISGNAYKKYNETEDKNESNNQRTIYRNDYIHFISSANGTLNDVVVIKSCKPTEISSIVPRYLLNQDCAVHNTPTTEAPTVAPSTQSVIAPMAATLAMQDQIKKDQVQPLIIDGKRYWICPTRGCNRAYDIKRSFAMHMAKGYHGHYRHQKFTCTQCGKKYANIHSFRLHSEIWCKNRISGKSDNNN